MTTEIKNNQIIITLDLLVPTLSKSGKTYVVAGTGGFVTTDVKVEGKDVKVSVNAIISK